MADRFMPQPTVQKTGPTDDFMPERDIPEVTDVGMEPMVNLMPEVAAPQTEPVGNFMPKMEVPGWDMAESVFAENSSQAESMALFSEETAPTKIYEPKRHKKESGSDFTGTVPAFQETEQTDKAGGDWMIYG
jgi:hypothetical protein